MSVWSLYITLIILWFLAINECFGYRSLGRMVKHAKKTPSNIKDEDLPGITVVIPVKNQFELLQRNLPRFLEQDYPNFEVWVVDMTSNDDTRWLLESLEDIHKNLHHTYTQATSKIISEPRFALLLGIKSASYDWIAFSQINCFPKTNQWLKEMGRSAASSDRAKIVVGYTQYYHPRGWAGLCLRFLRTWTNMFKIPYSNNHRYYTAEGTNLMYRKSLFEKYKGFAGTEKLLIGAMDILVNRHSTRKNTIACMHPNAFMEQQISNEPEVWSHEQMEFMEIRRYFKHRFRYRFHYMYHALLPYAFEIVLLKAFLASWDIMQWGMLLGIVFMQASVLWLSRMCFNFTLIKVGERKMFFRLPLLIALVPIWDIKAWIIHRLSSKKRYQRKIAPTPHPRAVEESLY